VPLILVIAARADKVEQDPTETKLSELGCHGKGLGFFGFSISHQSHMSKTLDWRSLANEPSAFTRCWISDMVTAMRLYGLGTFRKFALLIFMPVVLLGAGCNSFNREWKKVGRNAVAGSGLEGRWEGKWVSEKNGHRGKLRCIVKKDGEVYQARFHAKYQKILSFGYTVPLKVEPTEDGYKFSGEADLGSLAGGVYRYDGRADATNFFSTYSSQYDHGTFRMERPSGN